MGVFIENYVINQKHDLNVIKIIGVANPTSTDQNKFLDTKYVQDFDSFIHSNLYSYPDIIIKEFTEIKRIIDTYLILIQSKQLRLFLIMD